MTAWSRRHSWHVAASWRWLLLAALAAGLVLTHGCHGDEDNELWTCLIQRIANR